jgi:hypothetical protein
MNSTLMVECPLVSFQPIAATGVTDVAPGSVAVDSTVGFGEFPRASTNPMPTRAPRTFGGCAITGENHARI